MSPSMRPPNRPWQELKPKYSEGGYLSFYYSDDLSPLAVRAVTKPADNKSDPNIETLTYGLFSTCGHAMRASIVNKRIPYIFFITRRGDQRVVTGYYRVRWYANGPLRRKPPDYTLAADVGRFIDPALPVASLAEPVRSAAASPFRVYKRVNEQAAATLVEILNSQPDRTPSYVDEIRRLERFNHYRTGYCYVNWELERSWAWELAPNYLLPTTSEVQLRPASTTSPTDLWKCGKCHRLVRSKALLKRCPDCGALGTLDAVEDIGLAD